MLVRISTDKAVPEVATALQAAVVANQFGVMHVHNLKETMANKGVKFAHECLIFEVCQPQQAKKVLDEDMSACTALPCRISVYEEGGKTILATIKPTILLAMFDAPGLKEMAKAVEATLVKIMKEAANGGSGQGNLSAKTPQWLQSMQPEPQKSEKEFGKALKSFEELPAKTKELELLKDQAEKSSGQASLDLHTLIRDKFRQGDGPKASPQERLPWPSREMRVCP